MFPGGISSDKGLMYMSEYNSSDLSSTLVYIKSRFGAEVFAKCERVPALISDLALIQKMIGHA